jgi:hypothetical protein
MPVTKTYFDLSPMGSVTKTPEGFLQFQAPATRSGIFIYHNEDGSPRRAYRAPAEVFKRESMDSFKGKPIINNHQMGVTPKITADNVKGYQIGAIGENIRRENNLMWVSGTIHDKSGVEAVEGGRRGLSLAYDSDDIEEHGITEDGLEYDFRQTNIRGNHLAIVDRGRAGDVARIPTMDTADVEEVLDTAMPGAGEKKEDFISRAIAKYVKEGKTQEQAAAIAYSTWEKADSKDKTKHDSSTLSRSRRMKYNLDGCEVDAPESVINALVKARTDYADATGKLTAAQAEAKTLKTNLDTATANLDAAKVELTAAKAVDTEKLIQDGINARVTLLESASLICDAAELKDKKPEEVRLAVIKKVFGDMNMDGKSPDYVSAMFDAAVKAGDTEQRRKALAGQRKAAVSIQTQDTAVEDAAEAANKALENLYKTDCSKVFKG